MGLESGPDVADCGGAELDRRSFFGWHISTTMASSKHEERQYLWIVRHGLTKYPLTNGPVDGECERLLLDSSIESADVASPITHVSSSLLQANSICSMAWSKPRW